MSTSATESDGVGETSSGPAGWPQEWYGEYYLDPGLPLGVELRGESLIWSDLRNLRLEAGKISVERFTKKLGEGELAWTFSTELKGDALRVLPPNGEWDVPYFYYGASEVLLRPGAGCGELELEVYGPPTYDPSDLQRWLRGRLCVVDPYDDSVFYDKWVIDLCPGSTPDCGD